MNEEHGQLKQTLDKFAESKGFKKDVDDLTYWCENKRILMKVDIWFHKLSISLRKVNIGGTDYFIKSGSYAQNISYVEDVGHDYLNSVYDELKEELEKWSVKK